MFSTSLNEDVRYLQEDIQAVQDKIDDPVLCQKIEQYVQAPFEIQEMYRRDAVTEGLDLLVVILRSPDMPILSRPQVQRVYRAARAYREYKKWQQDLEDSDDDEGPDNDDAWLFEDLNILMKLMTRKREKESMLALIFEVGAITFEVTRLTYPPGRHCRAPQGHYHHFLLASRDCVQGCQHCRLAWRLAVVHQRHDPHRRAGRRV